MPPKKSPSKSTPKKSPTKSTTPLRRSQRLDNLISEMSGMRLSHHKPDYITPDRPTIPQKPKSRTPMEQMDAEDIDIFKMFQREPANPFMSDYNLRSSPKASSDSLAKSLFGSPMRTSPSKPTRTKRKKSAISSPLASPTITKKKRGSK